MAKADTVFEGIRYHRLIPLYYNDHPAETLAIAKALYSAGIRVIEFTNRGPHALENFRQLRSAADTQFPHLHIGAGTIMNAKEADAFMDAGADFIVSPIVLAETAHAATTRGILWIPGCMTATEIALAQSLGARLVKVFPANVLGPSFVSAVKEIFPGLHFMPTGGVEITPENFKSWFVAGVSALGLGSRLVSKTRMANQEYRAIETDARKALEILQTL
jgi:2-dehydro-3-deoxyphosphogluconate aldolase / (4S)-4-hydroxy-2-oxoglutarate aldolase